SSPAPIGLVPGELQEWSSTDKGILVERCVGRDIVPDVIVGTDEPESRALPAGESGVRAAAAVPHDADDEVPLDDIEVLRSVLGDDPGAGDVVEDVVAHQALVAAVDGDAPLEFVVMVATIDRGPDYSEPV